MINKYIQFFRNSLQYINEKTAAKRRGIILPTIIDELEKYADKNYFIHFSNIVKVGIFPKSEFGTPIGFYTYPITKSFIRNLKDGHVPFASERKYALVVKPKPGKNILKITGSNQSNLSEDDYIDILNRLFTEKKLEKYYGAFYSKIKDAYDNDEDLFNEMIEKLEREAGSKNNVIYLWDITNRLSRNSKQWGALFRALDIDGVFDKAGTSTIHASEPIQAVFFHKGAIDTVDAFQNTHTPEVVSKRKEREDISRNKKMYLEYREKGWPVPGDTVKFTDKFINNRDIFFPGDIVELTRDGAIMVSDELSDTYKIHLDSSDIEDIVGDTAEILSLLRFRYVYFVDHLGEPHSTLYPNGIIMDMFFNPQHDIKMSDPDGNAGMKKLEMRVKTPSLLTNKNKEFTVEFENPVMKETETMDLKYEDNVVKVIKKGGLLDRIK